MLNEWHQLTEALKRAGCFVTASCTHNLIYNNAHLLIFKALVNHLLLHLSSLSMKTG